MLKNPIEAVPLVGNFLGVAALVTVVLVTLVKPVLPFFLALLLDTKALARFGIV